MMTTATERAEPAKIVLNQCAAVPDTPANQVWVNLLGETGMCERIVTVGEWDQIAIRVTQPTYAGILPWLQRLITPLDCIIDGDDDKARLFVLRLMVILLTTLYEAAGFPELETDEQFERFIASITSGDGEGDD